MRLLACFLLLAAFALSAVADVNVTGKWSGSFNITNSNGETKDDTAFLVLKQNGQSVTGTAGPNEGEQYDIKTGKIDGDKLALEVEHEGAVIKFSLVITEDRIKGDAEMSREGETAKAKIDVTRAK
jgi:hypothetical protein